MKRSTFLFFLSGLAAGALCGITAGSGSLSPVSSSGKAPSTEIPRFGNKKTSASPSPSKQADKRAFRTDMEEQFMTYSRMSAEEIAAELKKRDKAGIDDPTDMRSYAAMLYLAQRWGQIAPAQAIEQCAGLKNIRNFIYADILAGWANNNPENVAAYYMEHRGDGDALAAAVTGLTKAYPEKAWQWLDSLSKNERKHALPDLLAALAASHPDQLSRTIQKLLPETQDNPGLNRVLVQTWMASDREAARKWMDSLSGSRKEQSMTAAFIFLTRSDSGKALQEFSALDGGLKEKILPHLLQTLALQSPEKALDCLLKNSSEEKSLLLVSEVLGHQSPVSARTREYVMEMNGGPVKDRALEHLISLTAPSPFSRSPFPTPPEDNLALAARITDPSRQEEQRVQLLIKWLQESPEKAREWIRKSDFSGQKKQSYLELENQGGDFVPPAF